MGVRGMSMEVKETTRRTDKVEEVCRRVDKMAKKEITKHATHKGFRLEEKHQHDKPEITKLNPLQVPWQNKLKALFKKGLQKQRP